MGSFPYELYVSTPESMEKTGVMDLIYHHPQPADVEPPKLLGGLGDLSPVRQVPELFWVPLTPLLWLYNSHSALHLFLNLFIQPTITSYQLYVGSATTCSDFYSIFPVTWLKSSIVSHILVSSHPGSYWWGLGSESDLQLLGDECALV